MKKLITTIIFLSDPGAHQLSLPCFDKENTDAQVVLFFDEPAGP
jgi:hypothetical protein